MLAHAADCIQVPMQQAVTAWLTFTERRRMPISPSAGPNAKLALRFMPFLPPLEPLCPASPLPRPAPAFFCWLPADERACERCTRTPLHLKALQHVLEHGNTLMLPLR